MEILNYQVSDGQSGIRIDRYLSEMNEELSRSYIQKLLKEQKITVNGSAVKANYKVQEGDEISVAVPDINEPIYFRKISLWIFFMKMMMYLL